MSQSAGTVSGNRCAWCEAPRQGGDTCPDCGANYAKAEAIRSRGKADAASVAAAAQTAATGAAFDMEEERLWPEVHDADFEYKMCLWAMPGMLGVMLLLYASGIGASLMRIVFGMPVHELGHAAAGWFTGFTAIPSLWVTLVPDDRGWLAPIALAGALGWMTMRAWQAGRVGILALGATLLLVQLICTFILDLDSAHMLITFGGDGLGMVLAAVLMMLFYVGKSTQIYRGALRWGFLAIGAAAFVDMLGTWWVASSDVGAIPYGTTGGRPTDAMKLVDNHGWSLATLVGRHLTTGALCIVALIVTYILGLRAAGRVVRSRQREERLAAARNAARNAARGSGG